jgi:hypothetical protein
VTGRAALLLLALATGGAVLDVPRGSGARAAIAPHSARAERSERAEPSAPVERIDIGAAAYTRNGVTDGSATRGEPGTSRAGSVRLPFTERGVRWATEFSSGAPGSVRLALEWEPGPDGLVFEVVLDGTRLSPARDGWRPSPRALTSDLGPAWLGPGAHLLEFVAREQAPDSALHLRALLLERL